MFVTQVTSTDNESKTSIWTVGNLVTECCFQNRTSTTRSVPVSLILTESQSKGTIWRSSTNSLAELCRKARRPKQWNWIDCFSLTVGCTKTEEIYPALRDTFNRHLTSTLEKWEPTHISHRKVCTQNWIQRESGPS